MSESESDQDFSDWVEEVVPCRSLFDDQTELASAKEAIQYDAEKHNFNVLEHSAKLSLDFYGYIRLVNYIRKSRCTPQEANALNGQSSFLRDDAFLKPALEDDPLLRV